MRAQRSIRAPPGFLLDSRTAHADVVVIGGGLSGLAASVDLASRGAAVLLCEAGPRLGGRCYSYVDVRTGDTVDNGQHVLLGAYHNVLEYLARIGSVRFLKKQRSLTLPLHHPEKGFHSFSVPEVPKPFDLPAGMLRFGLLTLQDRRRLLNVGLALRGWDRNMEESLSQKTVAGGLSGLGQSRESMECLWNPIALSVMNESPEEASALLFARALRGAFMGEKSDSSILLPTVGQSDLYVAGAIEYLMRRKAKILLNSEVRTLAMRGSGVSHLELQGGMKVTGGFIVSAVPYFALRRMIPPEFMTETPFEGLGKIGSSPIVSIHLWFEKDFMESDLLGLIGRRVQWLFNRRRIMRGSGKTTGYVSAVISAARPFLHLTKERLVEIALQDIRGMYPRTGRLLCSGVIKEKRATFSPTCGVERFRPGARTTLRHIFLAGDWTDTGLPATIEGAVVSGLKAARMSGGLERGESQELREGRLGGNEEGEPGG